MTLAQRAALLLSGLQWNRWERQTRDPAAAQKQLLREIVQRNQSTAFGRDQGFSSIKSVKDFRRQVAIGDYESFRPYIERAKQGEKAVLTSEPILMFTMTSGSTGEPKLIPVTESTRATHTRLTRLWYSRAFQDHPGSGAGKSFRAGGPNGRRAHRRWYPLRCGVGPDLSIQPGLDQTHARAAL